MAEKIVVTPEETKKCNGCGLVKNVSKDFKLVCTKGSTNPRPESRCKACKLQASYERKRRRKERDPEAYAEKVNIVSKRSYNKMRARVIEEKQALVEEIKQIEPSPEANSVKFCSSCEEYKPLDQFNTHRGMPDKLSSWCKECQAKYAAREARSPSGKARLAKQKRSIRQFINSLKDIPCMDCNQKYPPYAMDFDHRPGTRKQFNISTGGPGVSRTILLAEIAKCDIVCSNCHRIRTHNRLPNTLDIN